MAAVMDEVAGITPRLAHFTQPQVEVKLSLMRQLSKELQSRYGTQQVAADAMELHQTEISALYNAKVDRFSITFLIMIAQRLGKKVEVRVL